MLHPFFGGLAPPCVFGFMSDKPGFRSRPHFTLSSASRFISLFIVTCIGPGGPHLSSPLASSILHPTSSFLSPFSPLSYLPAGRFASHAALLTFASFSPSGIPLRFALLLALWWFVEKTVINGSLWLLHESEDFDSDKGAPLPPTPTSA